MKNIRFNRRNFIKTGLIFVPGWAAANAAVILPGPIMRTMEGSGAYTAEATDFSGVDTEMWLERDATPTGLVDGRIALSSFWIKPHTSGAGTLEFIQNDNSDGFYIFLDSSDILHYAGETGANVVVVDIRSSVAITRNSSAWTHCAFSFDLNTAGNRRIYINGVDRTSQTTFTTGNDVDFANGDFVVGAAVGGGVPFSGCISEFFFTTTAAYYDLSSAPNLAKFISGGAPVAITSADWPGGTQPIIYLKNAFSSFNVNSGSGGDMVKKGSTAFTNCSTHP